MSVGLCLSRCAYRAVCSACSAIDALALIDNIRCALSDSLNRAVAGANSAGDAVFRNLISHNSF